jgi:8-oxo-dGTP pyrophosphatase MutT (NUDIX family)
MPASNYVQNLRRKIGADLLQVPCVSVLVFDDQGRVLLLRHREGDQWTTPGGMVEPHESPADAAVREMWEETGLLVELTRLVGVFGGPLWSQTYANGDRVSWVAAVFAARPIGGQLRADGDEALELRYVAQSELARLPCKPHILPVLEVAFQGAPAAYFEPPSWKPD